MTKLENDIWLCMNYEDFTNFCITILRKAEWESVCVIPYKFKASLLDYIKFDNLDWLKSMLLEHDKLAEDIIAHFNS
jgi:hypothetical protein